MSESSASEENSSDFSGFQALFSELERHEENIRIAINRYSILQSDGTPTSSTPLGSPVRSLDTPFVTPIGSPQSSNHSRSNSEPSVVSDISNAVNSLPLHKSVDISLDNTHSDITIADLTMAPTPGQKKHLKARNAFTSQHNKVVKTCSELDTALKDTSTDLYRLRRLTSRLEAYSDTMDAKGKVLIEFEEVDFSEDFDEDKFYDDFDEACNEAKSLIHCGNAEIAKRETVIPTPPTPTPIIEQPYKYEKLQVEPFLGDHTIWPYWRDQAKDVIKGMSLLNQRMWLSAKIQGEAREFIGITNLNTLTIDQIFSRLNDNYGQPHLRAKTIAIANKDMVPLDESASMQDIEKFWNKYMNIADQCAQLKITAESLTITHAMLHLPPKFRERLEVKMREVKANYIFTRADAVTPFNLVKSEMLSSYPDNKLAHSYATSPIT